MKHKTAAAFDRPAEMHLDRVLTRTGLDIELVQQVREGNAVDQLVHHQPHRAVLGMGAEIDYRALESRIEHLRHGDEKLTRHVSGGVVFISHDRYPGHPFHGFDRRDFADTQTLQAREGGTPYLRHGTNHLTHP